MSELIASSPAPAHSARPGLLTRLRRPGLLARLRRDENGFTAVEFALVATPFLALLFGIIAVGLYFFVQFSLENAVEQASRMIRTGQAQTREPPMTTAQFKTEICNRAPSFIDCGGKVRVNVRLPVGVVSAGLKMGMRFAPQVEGLDLDSLSLMINSGDVGQILDVFDDKDGEHVEVFIE